MAAVVGSVAVAVEADLVAVDSAAVAAAGSAAMMMACSVANIPVILQRT